MSIELHNQTKNLILDMYSKIEFFTLGGDVYKFIPSNDRLSINIDINTLGNNIYNVSSFNNNNNNTTNYDDFKFREVISYVAPAECQENVNDEVVYRDSFNIFEMTDNCKIFTFYLSIENVRN